MTKNDISFVLLMLILLGLYVMLMAADRSIDNLAEQITTQTNTIYIVEVHEETMMDLLEKNNVNN